jgi:hypothetical protein
MNPDVQFLFHIKRLLVSGTYSVQKLFCTFALHSVKFEWN